MPLISTEFYLDTFIGRSGTLFIHMALLKHFLRWERLLTCNRYGSGSGGVVDLLCSPADEDPMILELNWAIAEQRNFTEVEFSDHPIFRLTNQLEIKSSQGTAKTNLNFIRQLIFRVWNILLSKRITQLTNHPRVILFRNPSLAPLVRYFKHCVRVYIVGDNFHHGHGLNLEYLERMEAAMMRDCDLIVPVSDALAQFLITQYGDCRDKILILPNAIPSRAIPSDFPSEPAPLPMSISNLKRPIAGVIGKISGRLRLDWLNDIVSATPEYTWLFAGGIDNEEMNTADKVELDALLIKSNCRFLGLCTFPEIVNLAACVDVGVLPYSSRSVNPFGSASRFYLHLGYGQPMVATPGCLQLHEYQPLVKICNSPGETVSELNRLRELKFDDGLRLRRWEAAQSNSWKERARQLLSATDTILKTI